MEFSNLKSKYEPSKTMELCKETFGCCRWDQLINLRNLSSDEKLPCSEFKFLPCHVSEEKLCFFLNQIFEYSPFSLCSHENEGIVYEDIKELYLGDKKVFAEHSVRPFLNILQKVIPFHWVLYPHAHVVFCVNESQVIHLILDHYMENYAHVEEFIFSDPTWSFLKKELPIYTSAERISVFDITSQKDYEDDSAYKASIRKWI